MFHRNRLSVSGHYHRGSTNLRQFFPCNVGFVEPQLLRFLDHNREVSWTVRRNFVVASYKRRSRLPESLRCERSDPVQILWRLSLGIEEPAYRDKAFDQVRSGY